MALASRTVAVRLQLLGMLREPGPDGTLSTPEMRRRMANGGQHCNSYMAVDGGCDRGWGRHPLARCIADCWHGPIYANLRALLELGLVERITRPDLRCVLWRLLPDDQSDEYFNRVLAAAEQEEIEHG